MHNIKIVLICLFVKVSNISQGQVSGSITQQIDNIQVDTFKLSTIIQDGKLNDSMAFFQAYQGKNDTLYVAKNVTIQLDTFKLTSINRVDNLSNGNAYLEPAHGRYILYAGINIPIAPKEIFISSKKDKYFEFSTDQDVLSKDNEDRDYTMGVRLQWYISEGDFLLRHLRLPYGVKGVNKFLGKDPKQIKKFTSAGLTHSAFTPRQIELYNVDSTDRPYAGVTLLNSSATYSKTLRCSTEKTKFFKALKFEGIFGLLGKLPSNISAFVQTGIHAGQAVLKNDTFPLGHPMNTTRPIPRGWPNAIGGNSNFLIYNYTISHFYGLNYDINSDEPVIDWLSVNIKQGASITLGNLYSNLGLSLSAEFGWYDIAFFSNESNVYYDATKSSKNRWFDLSFICNAEINYWLYNAALQGRLGGDSKSPYILSASQVKDWTAFYEYGIRFTKGTFSATYLKAFRTPTNELDSMRNQSFGRLFFILKY